MSLLEQNVSDGQTKRTTPAQDQTMQNVQLIGWMKYSIATAPKYWSMDKLQRAAKEFSAKPGAERWIYRVRPEDQ